MGLEKATGIVIKSMNYGENDRLLTIFTAENGKMTAIAKGAKNPRSVFIGSTQLFSYCNFIYYTGRSFAYLNQAEILESFHKLRNDLEKLSRAAYMAEILNNSYEDYNSDPKALKLTLNLLYFMNEGLVEDNDLILLAFQLKIMAILGFATDFDSCQRCGEEKENYVFSARDGGTVCTGCGGEYAGQLTINREEAGIMKLIMDSPLNWLKSAAGLPENLLVLNIFMNRYIEHFIGRKNKSFEFIASM
ncbi:MAG: DNA repair protein RecO [Eubacteriaceae bacterium]|nr:DNA repair protein RecO [Eubacteriaceae bacterium]